MTDSDPWLEDALADAGWSSRAIAARTAELLSDGRGFTGTVHCLTAPDAPDVILKHPDADPTKRERAAREIHFLRHLDDVDPERRLVCARLLCAQDDADIRLLLEPIEGTPGDVCAAPDPAQLTAMVDAVAVLHALPVDADDPPAWLARWGVGQLNENRPHRRRAERYAKRLDPFLDWWGGSCPPDFVDLLESLVPRAETILADAAAVRPLGLIHADLHLDNVIFAPDGRAVLIDWQSVSLGPVAYDIARLLAEATDDLDFAERLIARAHQAMRLPESFADDVRTMLLATSIGFVCGYGGRDPAHAHPRERAMMEIALGQRLGRLTPRLT